MNCKPTLFAVYLFLLSLPLQAQYSIGLEGGFSLNSLNTNVSNRISTRLVSDWGFNVALPLLLAYPLGMGLDPRPGSTISSP